MTEYEDVHACTDCHYHHPKKVDESTDVETSFISEAIDHIATRTAEGALNGLLEAAKEYMNRRK